jgi:hypothetical protein
LAGVEGPVGLFRFGHPSARLLARFGERKILGA